MFFHKPRLFEQVPLIRCSMKEAQQKQCSNLDVQVSIQIPVRNLNYVFTMLCKNCPKWFPSFDWSDTFKSFLNPVFIVHKGVIRAMFWVNRITQSQGLFEELELLKFNEDLKCVTVSYVYRSLANPWLNEFKFQAHVRYTRQTARTLLFEPNWTLNVLQKRYSILWHSYVQ